MVSHGNHNWQNWYDDAENDARDVDIFYPLHFLEGSEVEWESEDPEESGYVEEPPEGQLDKAVVKYKPCRVETEKTSNIASSLSVKTFPVFT